MSDYNKNNSFLYNTGFSLVELLVVIAIGGILLAISALAFNQMMNKSRADAQIRQLATDISELRIRAMTRKQPHGILINPNNYSFRSYTAVSAAYLSPVQQTVVPSSIRNVTFPMNDAAGNAYNNVLYEFDERGVLTRRLLAGAVTGSLGFTVFLGGSGTSGSVDCLTVSTVRTNAGKNTAGVCNDR